MKRIFSLILALFLCITPLVGCGDKKEDDPTGDELIESKDYAGDMTKYIQVPDLKDIVISDKDIEKDWQTVMLNIRLDSTDYQKTDDPEAAAKLYDLVNIDYTLAPENDLALTDAVKAAIGDGGHDVIIGSGTMIGAYSSMQGKDFDTASFEDQLIGAKAGESLKVTVTFPDDYRFADAGEQSDALAGARCIFDVKINSISKGEIPEFTNALVLKYTSNKYSTVDEYRTYVYNYYRALDAYDGFVSRVTLLSYPEEELYTARLNYITEVISRDYANTDLDDEDVRTLYDMLYTEADTYARSAVFERMILEYLFDVCRITLTENGYLEMLKADYTAGYLEYYMSYGIANMSDYELYFGKENLVLQYKYQKMMDVLPTYVTITD